MKRKKTNNILIRSMIFLIPIFIVLFLIFIVLFTYTKYGTISTQSIQIPLEYNNSYRYKDSDLESCYLNSQNIYGVAKCYNDSLINSKPIGRKNSNIEIILYLKDDLIYKYSIFTREYNVALGDVGEISNIAVTFDYPSNQILGYEKTPINFYPEVSLTDFKKIKEDFNKEPKIIKYENEIVFPFELKETEDILKKGTFSKDNSDIIVSVLKDIQI